jgi:hypothetical protein
MALRAWRSALTRVAVAMILAAIIVLFSIAVVFYARAEVTIEWVDWLQALGTATWLATFSLVGVLVVLRRPSNIIGWLCIAFSLVWAGWSAADAALRYDALVPGTLSNAGLLAGLTHPLWVPGVGIVGLLLLLFPDGEVPSRRWRPVLWALLAVITVLTVTAVFLPGAVQDQTVVNPLGIEAFEVFDSGFAGIALVLALIASIALSALSVVFRYRRAGMVERLQLKWLMAAAVVSAVAYAAMFAVEFEVQLVFSLIPLAIGFAMHRHRLYGIDRLISRTVVYAIVVAALALVYAGTVFALREIVPGDGGLAVAGSTLAVAAIFDPLRRRVQVRVDRFFNRSHYDAERVAAGFAGGLRDETDADRIVRGWVGVVSETMQPTAVGVWTRE